MNNARIETKLGLRWLWGLIIIFLSIAFCAFLPIAAPIFPAAPLLVGGIITYRRSADATVQGVAVAVIVSGIILALIGLWVVIIGTPVEVSTQLIMDPIN